jgi:hypothetical protein
MRHRSARSRRRPALRPPGPRIAWILVAIAIAVLAARTCGRPRPVSADDSAPLVHGHRLAHRWVLLQTNFQAQGVVERTNTILDQAAAAGYNGVVLGDVKFGRLDDGSLIPAYDTNLQAVLAHARDLGLEAIPGTADFGYSDTILWHDPNLAEGLPVRGATFRVQGSRLVPFEATPVRLVNADFEQLPPSGHTFPGWSWQDQPGVTTFVDAVVKHGGRASLRMTDIGTSNPPHGHGRIHQRITVEPFRYYHASVWIKTQDFGGGEVRVLALAQNPNRTLQWANINVRPTQDWTRYDVTFNTLTHTEVLFYFGVWGGGDGTIWWDDGAIEPAGFVNLVRRPGTPVVLTTADGATTLEEGRDVAPVVDPLMGSRPWKGAYDTWHAPPEITVPSASRLAEGDVVRAGYYHVTTVYDGQVTASLTEPSVFPIVDGQLGSLRREFDRAGVFTGWMLGYDEIRVGGWDAAPAPGGGTPGEKLAYSFRTVYDLARTRDPRATLLTWSDMFDPFHNAGDTADPYYLVNGNWAGSWAGVPSDVVIANWNHGARARESAEFFASRGHRQILAGYYDTPPERFNDRQWLAELEGVPGIEGVLYCQWGSGFGNLGAWARHVWGDAPWVTPEPAGTPGAEGTPTGTPGPGSTPTDTPTPEIGTPTGQPSPTASPAAGRAFLPWIGR